MTDRGHPGETPWASMYGGPVAPWLFLYGAGLEACDAVQAGARECPMRCVRPMVVPLDEYHESILVRAAGLVIFWPTAPSPHGRQTKGTMLLPVARAFRNKYPVTAAEAFLPSSQDWPCTRPIQFVYPEDALNDPIARELLGCSDAGHVLVRNMPFSGAALFDLYLPGMAQRMNESDEITASIEKHWQVVRRWGIQGTEDVIKIKDGYDEQMKLLEKPRKRAMYRPTDEDMNRLRLIAIGSDAKPTPSPDESHEDRELVLKRFRESGATAVRDATNAVLKDHPWFHRPSTVDGTKGAQDAFTELYGALRILRQLAP